MKEYLKGCPKIQIMSFEPKGLFGYNLFLLKRKTENTVTK